MGKRLIIASVIYLIVGIGLTFFLRSNGVNSWLTSVVGLVCGACFVIGTESRG